MKYLKTYESNKSIYFLYPTKDEDVKETCEYLNKLHIDFKLYKNIGYKTLFKDINTFIAFKDRPETLSDILINRSIQFTDSTLLKDIRNKEIEFDEVKQEEINFYLTAKKYNVS